MKFQRETRRAQKSSLSPLEVAQIYNFPKGDGEGRTIGIVELGGGWTEGDLLEILHRLDQAMPEIHIQILDGGSTSPQDQDYGLVDLVVLMALAPKATFNLYYAPNNETGFYQALRQATMNNQIVLVSWGAEESKWSPGTRAAFQKILSQANARGVLMVAATPDQGSSFPSCSPEVLSVGGTRMVIVGQTVVCESGITQGRLHKAGEDGNMNGLPDVSAFSEGFWLKHAGESMVAGGSSVAAAIWAGLWARLDPLEKPIFPKLRSFLYQNPHMFNEVNVERNNGGMCPSIGWEAGNGLGSPRGSEWFRLFLRECLPLPHQGAAETLPEKETAQPSVQPSVCQSQVDPRAPVDSSVSEAPIGSVMAHALGEPQIGNILPQPLPEFERLVLYEPEYDALLAQLMEGFPKLEALFQAMSERLHELPRRHPASHQEAAIMTVQLRQIREIFGRCSSVVYTSLGEEP